MEEDLRIIIDHLQTQRNDAYNIACNYMLTNTKLQVQIDELKAQIKEIESYGGHEEEQRRLQEGQFTEGIEPSGQGQSSKEDKHSKSKV